MGVILFIKCSIRKGKNKDSFFLGWGGGFFVWDCIEEILYIFKERVGGGAIEAFH